MDYTINNYRTRKLGKHYFVTTDSGSFIVLPEDEYRKLRSLKIDKALFRKLHEREIVLDSENMEENIQNLRKRFSFLFTGTSLHIMVLTLRCNMGCVYCHASSKSETGKGYDMDREIAKKTIDFIFQSPNSHINIEFQGGEPLLNWDVLKYSVEYAKEQNKKFGKNLIFSLVTNMTKMDEEKATYLIDNAVGVCASLDGPKELHDLNRPWKKGKSNYDTVVRWIRWFQREYKRRSEERTRINALITLTKKSLRYPDEIVDEYAGLGLRTIHFRLLNKLGVAQKTWANIEFTAEEFLEFWKKAVKRIDYHKKKGAIIEEFNREVVIRKISRKTDPNFYELRSPCGAAIGQLLYNYDGKIYTCDEGRMIGEDLFMLGDVKDDTYSKITTCDKACSVVNASINDQYVCDNCAYKPYCGVCPVCNYAEQGSIIGKISETDRCKVFMGIFDWVVMTKFIKEETDS